MGWTVDDPMILMQATAGHGSCTDKADHLCTSLICCLHWLIFGSAKVALRGLMGSRVPLCALLVPTAWLVPTGEAEYSSCPHGYHYDACHLDACYTLATYQQTY